MSGKSEAKRLSEPTARVHEVKTWADPFRATWSGDKPYEIRNDDRGYRVGDVLHEREWYEHCDAYSGREMFARITHKTSGGEWGLPSGLCVLGIRVIERVEQPRFPNAR